MLKILNDEKVSFIRVAIIYIEGLVRNEPKILNNALSFINKTDYFDYKESMYLLPQEDFKKIKKSLKSF